MTENNTDDRSFKLRRELARLVTEEYADLNRYDLAEEFLGATATTCVFVGLSEEESLEILRVAMGEARRVITAIQQNGIPIGVVNNEVPEA
tara:strand:+ start:520 stop:792 length:273 start_codon:yes stop_codon:yes gene_type:complete